MTRHARPLALGGLAAASAAAACAPPALQLAFAIVAIGIVGMAHGASDLAIVPPARRPGFVAAYLLVLGACLLWWAWRPAMALPLFMAASALHFALEDAPGHPVWEQAARGIGMIALPATLHLPQYTAVLAAAGGPSGAWVPLAAMLGAAGGVLGAVLLGLAWRRRDPRLLGGVVALLALPPLVGFSVGFLVLHALPQTAARQAMLGCRGLTGYLRATGPVLLLAVVLAAAIGLWLLPADQTGIRPLFAAIAALAMPHLLVTPCFEAAALPAPRGG